MTLLLLGVNHRTAPIELREKLAIAPNRLAEATRAMMQVGGLREGLILSTCNRIELLVSIDSQPADLLGFLNSFFTIEKSTLQPHVYEHKDREAVRHLFRVAASLDSMVVGEPQILGQVKESYAAAKAAGSLHAQLEGLLQRAFAVAKKVRSETEIGSSSVSIASVAVDLAQKIFGSLHGKTVMLVGAGKMSELAARHLMARGAGTILIVNRTHERAQRLASEFGGKAIRYEELQSVADQADIVITSTGAPHPIFTRQSGQALLQKRRNRPMFFIDIAVPRDVDPEMNRLDGIFVYDIDDLQSVAASHMGDRSREAERAEKIIAAEVERYHERQQTLDVVPTIMGLQRNAEHLRQLEMRRMQGRLQSLTAEQAAAVEALTRGIMNKFLHQPLQAIKTAAREGDITTVDTVRHLFHIEETDLPEPALKAVENGNTLDVTSKEPSILAAATIGKSEERS
jgi:glutamyl-tRNA reductase